MNENEYISSLKARDIRPTALRVLILRTMAGFDRAFSLADLEEELDTVDKSTLFRTLTLFLAHHLVHGIDDGDRNRCGRSAAAENRSAPDRRTLPFVGRRSGLDARRADRKFAR